MVKYWRFDIAYIELYRKFGGGVYSNLLQIPFWYQGTSSSLRPDGLNTRIEGECKNTRIEGECKNTQKIYFDAF